MTYLRNDFFQTETELYQENCLDILHDWLNEKGMYLRAENSYGKTFEVSQTVSSVDYLETESFEFAADVDSYRNFTGAAHIYDKRLSSESGASIMIQLSVEQRLLSSDFLYSVCSWYSENCNARLFFCIWPR